MKKYIKPQIEIIELEADVPLLAGSGGGVNDGDMPGNEYDEGVESLSLDYDNYSVWDDELGK